MSASGKIASTGKIGVVTRFAPSPTGYLHIGGARTALFNWLFARHHGGKYLLRIEDTDKARSTKEAIDAILDGLDWLGIERRRRALFPVAVRDSAMPRSRIELIERGAAYRCYLTPEELAGAARKGAGRAPAVPHRQRMARPHRLARGRSPIVVRIKAPREGETAIDDLVQGRVTVANAELDDFVLLRSDGTPTYMLAVVVDDHDMGVTHIIRGDDHLNNAFRQLAIIRAMGWPEPTYAHIPLIHGPDGAKLSASATARWASTPIATSWASCPKPVQLSAAARLGPWRRRDHQPRARRSNGSTSTMSARSPSRFDLKKLENLNGHYIREADDARLAELVAPKLGLERRANCRCWSAPCRS